MMMLYRDYTKDARDLLITNFAKPGDWRVENRARALKGSYAIGTTASQRGGVSVDVEGLTADGAYYGMLTVTPKPFQDLRATVRAENLKGHRVEALLSNLSPDFENVSFEVSHETVAPLANGRLRVNDRVTDRAVELGLSLAALQNVQVGCGATYGLKSQNCDWSVAMRALSGRYTSLSVQTAALRSVTANVVTVAPIHPKFSPRVAATATVNTQSLEWDGSVGAEWACQVILGNMAKARVDKNLDWVLSYIAYLTGGWTLTLSFDKSQKAGMTLSRI